MPFTKIWIHLIWTTKNRHPFLSQRIRSQVISHIQENAIKKEIYIDFINGYTEHLHALISLKSNQTIAEGGEFSQGVHRGDQDVRPTNGT